MDKLIVKPLSVTSLNPICVNGRLRYWNMKVTYKDNLTIRYPLGLPMEKFGISLNPIYVIPARSHAIEAVCNQNSGNTTLTYSFDVGIFGIGGCIAKRFRKKTIWQMNHK